MKPWEMNWEQSNTAIEPASATPAKPWEMNWKSAENPEIDVNAYNGTSLIGQPGEDAKPYSKMDLFMKKLFTFEVRDAAESQKNNSRIQTLEKIRRDGFDDVKWGEVGKSAVRGSFELGKGVTASPLKIYGDWAMDNRDTSLMTPKEADEVKRNNFRAQSYVKIGEYIEKIWDMGIKADWLKEDEETFKGSFVENPSMTRVLSLAASALPSVGFFGGISKITGSRKVASILLAGADAGDIYFEAREAGESQNKALGLYALGTAGTAALEKYGFDQIFNERVTAPLGKRILKAAMSEGFTETFQTGYQNAVKKYGYDDTQELLEGVVEAFIAGSLSGGAISSADAGYIKLQRAREKLKEKGASDNALDVIQEEFARELSYHRDTIEPMFQSKITESLNNLDKFVKEHEGTAEAQKALQTKADLEQVYTDVSERLKKVGVSENVANADAKIWQGIALWGSQESGLSPLEYIKQRMPKVERTTYEQFKNKGKTLEEKLDDYIPFQAMYRSKLPDFGSFYDDIVKNENTKDRYFTEDINGVGLDISRSAIFHDKDGHQLSKNEWLGVIDALKANKIKQARIGDYSKMRGEPVKMVVDVNGVEYGVVFEHMQSGRNLISTVFVLTDKGWMNPKQKKRSQTEASEPLPQSRLLGNALPDIIAALDENVNKTLYQTAFAGSRVDYNRPSLQAIGSGEGAQAHGWGLYYALNKDVAESYRKTFIGESTDTNLGLANYYLRKNEFDVDLAIDALQEDVYNGNVSEDTAKEIFEYFENTPQSELEQNARRKGQVHEVDIPENPYLLDEQKPFSEQSEFVKEALQKLNNAEDLGLFEKDGLIIKPESTGNEIYQTIGKLISSKIGRDEKTSKLLEKHGIKGITYDGKQDGRCFVIFNPDDVKVIQKFYQGQDGEAPKGAYMQNLDRNGVIYLFEKADASTFMHETAHFFRKELEGFDTARSREMLQKMSEWENQEFDKRYKLKEENGRYVVTDKVGNVIYGAEKPFFDAETAREYARNEIFARGFEQYLREGKAPNNYLKQAFRSFWNWLRHLYKAADELGVDINDSIRSVYGEIIGGKDLDFYLTAPVDEVLQQHFAENEERQKEYDRQIALAQAQPVKRGFFRNIAQERTESAKGRNEWWNKAVVPISTRAKRVNIKLRNKLRAYDYGVGAKLNQYYAQIKPFLDKWAKMTETDAIAFDLALKNSYVEKQLEIVNKYDAYDEFVAVKNLLNSLFDQAVDVGIEMGYSADYFPRQIDDVEGFMSAMYGSPYASQLRRALKEADPDNVMTNEERAEFFNKYLRGFNRRDLNKPLPGNVKDRTIDIVTAEMNRYYKPSMQALINYIEGMNTSIESRKFWGFKSDDIDRSIGALTANMIDSGLIKPEQDAEVQEILRARFKARGVTNKYLLTLRNWAYMYTMGGINSAITQIDDISSSLYKAGLWNTVEAVFSRNRPGLSREELGLERIGQEFVEASTSSKAIRGVFKLTGLDKIDAFGKNTLINATFNKFQKMADNNEKELRARLEPVLEEETSQTIADIKNGVISENVKLLMFNELADMQPISLSEMPEWYLTGGNGRVFYMLKTFLIKRLDIFRNECYDKYKQGNVKTSVQNLFRLSILMMMTGMSKDAIIDMLFGREFDLTDAVVNNFLGLFGLSKYSLYQARYEGPKAFLEAFLIPPIYPMAEDLFSDVYKSLFSKKGKDISDYEIWKGFPLVGRFYYWWGGGGRTKLEKKNKKKLK